NRRYEYVTSFSRSSRRLYARRTFRARRRPRPRAPRRVRGVLAHARVGTPLGRFAEIARACRRTRNAARPRHRNPSACRRRSRGPAAVVVAQAVRLVRRVCRRRRRRRVGGRLHPRVYDSALGADRRFRGRSYLHGQSCRAGKHDAVRRRNERTGDADRRRGPMTRLKIAATIAAMATSLALASAAPSDEPADGLVFDAMTAPASVSYAGTVQVVSIGNQASQAWVYRIEHRAPDLTERTYLSPPRMHGDEILTRAGQSDFVDVHKHRVY